MSPIAGLEVTTSSTVRLSRPPLLTTVVYAGLGPHAEELERVGMPTGGAAVGRLALLTAVFVLLAVRRMRRLRFAGGGE